MPWKVGGIIFNDIPTSHSWVVFLGLSHFQRIESDLGLHMGSLLLFSLGCGGLLGATVQPDDAGRILGVGRCVVQSGATVPGGE